MSRTAVAAWFLAAHVVLLAFGLVLFEDRAATLHPSNRHLLLSRPTIPAQVAPPGPALVSPLRYFAAERLDAKAGRVRDELRADPEIARNHYGRSVALVGVFLLLALERRFWTDRTIRVLDWLVRPILYLVAIVLLLTLPAAYGVLSGDDLRMRLRRGRGRGEIPRPAAPDRSLTPGPLPRVPRAPRPVSG